MTTTTKSTNRPARTWQTYAIYALMALLTLAFVVTGGGKLAGAQMQVDNFVRWGYPTWFRYLTGALELAGVVLLWLRPTRFYGAVLLVGVMAGAVLTHLTHSEAAMAPVPFVLLVLAAIVAWNNRPAQLFPR